MALTRSGSPTAATGRTLGLATRFPPGWPLTAQFLGGLRSSPYPTSSGLPGTHTLASLRPAPTPRSQVLRWSVLASEPGGVCHANGDSAPDVIDLEGGSRAESKEPGTGGARSFRLASVCEITPPGPCQGRIRCYTRVHELTPVAEIQVEAILNLKRGWIVARMLNLQAIPCKVRFRPTCTFTSQLTG